MHYIHIRIEVVGSINSNHIKASMMEDGNYAKIQIKFPRGSELTNPKHVLTHYPDMDELHPLYLAMSTIHCFYGKANEKKEEELLIKLPFTCDPHGFYDPIDEDDEFLDLGSFPLDLMPTNSVAGGPAPSTKFLHLFCEEQKKAKLEQKTQQHLYFMTLSPSVNATSNAAAGGSPMGTWF